MSYSSIKPVDRDQPVLRAPGPGDAHGVHRLINNCPPLDGNSLYCNLLQCTHFAQTSICAELEGEIVGFVSGYLLPERPNTLFIWQVAVDAGARGQGLARRMLYQLLRRDCCREINYLETSVTPDNKASRALFDSIAEVLQCYCDESLLFDRDRHFKGTHDSELLLRIGPFHAELIGIEAGLENNSPLPNENIKKVL